MIKVKSFRDYYSSEDHLAKKLEDFLNANLIERKDIISIKYFSENNYIVTEYIIE